MTDPLSPDPACARRRCAILDFGGVISRTLFEDHAWNEQALGLPPGTLTWRGPFAPDTDEPWRRMQAGEISERDYWRLRTRETGERVGEHWTDMATMLRRLRGAEPNRAIRPEAIAFVAAVRARGLRLAVLSNELDLFYGADFRGRIDLLRAFELIVDASDGSPMKPDPRAYRGCLDALGLTAGEAVFVDDQPRNVEGARAIGLHAVWFDVCRPQASYDEALAALAPG
jgi:putative hydrolase of the HAD superfamily